MHMFGRERAQHPKAQIAVVEVRARGLQTHDKTDIATHSAGLAGGGSVQIMVAAFRWSASIRVEGDAPPQTFRNGPPWGLMFTARPGHFDALTSEVRSRPPWVLEPKPKDNTQVLRAPGRPRNEPGRSESEQP